MNKYTLSNEGKQVAALYCRISKEDLDKGDRGNISESIQNQKLMLIDYAASQGFLIYNVYVDEDLSGFSDRPGFMQMIQDAKDRHFDIIICKSQSRFTRDMELVERYIHGYFIEWGIRFIGITDNIDTKIKGNKKARQIYGLINEWYSEDLSENIRAVFRKKMEMGQFLGSFACYGYERSPSDRHKLIVDEEAAEVIRRIFSLYLSGMGTYQIAVTLTQNNTPTPTQHKANKGLKFQNPNSGQFSSVYGAWSAGSVRRILQNQAYIGVLIQGRERKLSYKSKKTVIAPENEWIVVKDNHEPIIEKRTFDKVQSLMKNRRTNYAGKGDLSREKALPHLLAGKVVCADCGSTMQRSGLSRDGKTHYLRCKLSAKTRRRDCTPHCISQEKIEDILKSKICEIIRLAATGHESEILENISCEAKKAQTKFRPPDSEHLILDLTSKINALNKHITSAYSDKLNGLISEEDFLMFKSSFEEERASLTQRKSHLEQELASQKHIGQSLKSIQELLHRYKTIDNLTHEIINDFVNIIQIGEKDPKTRQQEVIISWAF